MVKEALDHKYKEMEESKPILEVLNNYMTYQKMLHKVMMGRAKLSSEEYGEEEKMRIVEHGLPKKMCDLGNFVRPVWVNETVEMSALADTGASVNVLPYFLFNNLGLRDPKPYNSNLTMADNTQSKAIVEFKNVRIQIEYQAYLVYFLVLDIPVDKKLPLLLVCPFSRTYRAVIDMGCGHDENGNPKYGPIAPSFLDIEDDMKRALAMESYFNPFKNIIVFKKLVDFLGNARLIVWITIMILKAMRNSHPNPLIENYKKRNKQGTVEHHVQQVKNANLKWREVPSMERHAYSERLTKLQGSIVLSSGYEIGRSSAGFHEDNDFDPIVHSKDCVASDNDDDDMRD
nr:hypothetical protein [Tanacetum cinerariifolium]